eukprot:Gb_25141 [translate_table: standard]
MPKLDTLFELEKEASASCLS